MRRVNTVASATDIIKILCFLRFLCVSGFDLLNQVYRPNHHVDQLDSDERRNHSAQTEDQKVSPQQRFGAQRPVLHAAQRQRNQRE